MGKKNTDTKLLVKGLKRLALGLPLIVITTYILTFAFLNKDTIPIYIFLTLGIIAMGVTIYLMCDGIKLILKSIF
jgi:multidrug efflux pump subunit AcrB